MVVIDELAHTNIPGSKNEKRWQDVLEILEAGINVISAINIQHVERVCRSNWRPYFKVEVKERVPDKVIDMADELLLIDISVEDIIGRLKEGKIYKKEKIETALANFFQEEHLQLLRELAVKEIASHTIKKHEKTTIREPKWRLERFMVCIGTDEKKARS